MARFTHPAFGDTDGLTTQIKSYSPLWSGIGLAFTNTPTTGSYIKIGNLITVQIDVLFTNVSNFGTGQYSLTIPFKSSNFTIWNIGSSAKDEPFDHNSPFILSTADKFHMSFSYICE